MDDPEATRLLVERIKEHFPHLTLVARARNVQEYLELRRQGVEVVERETFRSSLALGRTVLSLLGMGRYEVFERSEVFRRHNLAMLEALLPIAHDEAKRSRLARSARDQLQELMEQEQQKFGQRSHAGWDASDEENPEAEGQVS